MRLFILCILSITVLSGCIRQPRVAHEPVTVVRTEESTEKSRDDAGAESSREIPPPPAALFRAGQDLLSDNQIKSILSGRVDLPEKGHLAVMYFSGYQDAPAVSRGRQSLQSGLRQSYLDALSGKLESAKRIVAVTMIPPLLVSEDAPLSVIREAAARLQADLLLVFRVTSGVQQEGTSPGPVEAHGKCEAVLMDVKSGIIPFTTAVSAEAGLSGTKPGSNNSDADKRAEEKAAMKALNRAAAELELFFKSVP